MSKDLNMEYRTMLNEDLPDLWDRISAALPEKQPQPASSEEPFRPEPVRSETAGRRKRTRIYQIAGLAAAACVCAAIIIPVALMSGNQNETRSSAEITASRAVQSAMEQTGGAAAEAKAAAEAAPYEEYEEYAEYEESALSGGAAEAAIEAQPDMEEAAALEEAAAEEAMADASAAAGAADTEAPVYEQVSVEIIAVYPEEEGRIRLLARLQQPCEPAGLAKDDQITLIADADSDPAVYDSLAPHCLYGLNLREMSGDSEEKIYHIESFG